MKERKIGRKDLRKIGRKIALKPKNFKEIISHLPPVSRLALKVLIQHLNKSALLFLFLFLFFFFFSFPFRFPVPDSLFSFPYLTPILFPSLSFPFLFFSFAGFPRTLQSTKQIQKRSEESLARTFYAQESMTNFISASRLLLSRL
jgi:hypothetical protein